MALLFVRQITNGQQGILIQDNYNIMKCVIRISTSKVSIIAFEQTKFVPCLRLLYHILREKTIFLSNIVKKTSYIVYNMEIISKCADYI